MDGASQDGTRVVQLRQQFECSYRESDVLAGIYERIVPLFRAVINQPQTKDYAGAGSALMRGTQRRSRTIGGKTSWA